MRRYCLVLLKYRRLSMKKNIFILTFWFAQLGFASDKTSEFTEHSLGGCNGTAVFTSSEDVKSVSVADKTGSNVLMQGKNVFVSSDQDFKMIVESVSGEKHRVSFNSKSCQMPSKTYEGCFSKKQEIEFKNGLKTVFSSEPKSFLNMDNKLIVSSLTKKHNIIYIQEQGKEVKPILLINKCS